MKVEYSKTSGKQILSLNTILFFGKYKNKSINWVCENDRSYIIWLIISSTNFNFNPEIKTKLGIKSFSEEYEKLSTIRFNKLKIRGRTTRDNYYNHKSRTRTTYKK